MDTDEHNILPVLLTLDMVKKIFGWSRTTAYNLAAQGKIELVKSGGRTMAKYKSCAAHADSLPAVDVNLGAHSGRGRGMGRVK
jgi:hypothetical protein